jgi:hypothetical protein
MRSPLILQGGVVGIVNDKKGGRVERNIELMFKRKNGED